jgi:hypothetical protein
MAENAMNPLATQTWKRSDNFGWRIGFIGDVVVSTVVLKWDVQRGAETSN